MSIRRNPGLRWRVTATMGLLVLGVSLAGSLTAAAQDGPNRRDAVAVALNSAVVQTADKPSAEAQPATTVTMNELETAFAEKMNGSVLVGQFTVDGRDRGAKPERYEIDSVKKLNNDDDWVVTARIKYGTYDVKVPVTLKILWAGDTPVMTLTDLTIPLMGTFTARVLFHGDRYVGTWQHGKVGGHMYGTVEKAAAQPAPGTDAPAENR